MAPRSNDAAHGDVECDRYRRRREAGEVSRARTRRNLLAAADELFRAQGYVPTTVNQIVRRAGVSVQTLYLTWGSKRALLRAAADAAAASEDAEPQDPPAPESWRSALRERLVREAVAPDLAGHLDVLARAFVELAERSAPYWRIYRQAAAVDTEVAEDWASTIAARRATLHDVVAALPQLDESDQSAPSAADTLFALVSPDTYDLLTDHAGYSGEQYRAWLSGVLRRTLLGSTGEG